MAANNYFGFTHGGTQYGAAATGTAYPAAQAGYAVAPAATAATAYSTQRAGYDQAYQAAAATQGTYASAAAAPAVTYDYGYGRSPAQPYDASKTYYQQAPTTATYAAAAQTYDVSQTAAAKVTGYQTAQYVAGPTRNTVQTAAATKTAPPVPATTYNANQSFVPQTTYSQPVQAATATKPAVATTNAATYSNYDAALYSAATMYVAQQTNKTAGQTNQWHGYKKGYQGNQKSRIKPQPKPQQLHYCEVCKISCAGPQTYREHLEGQRHKRREASLKLTASATNTSQNRGNTLNCELCDVTCTGNDAYAAHVRGAKHQKTLKLHQRLGKPIPTTDPTVKKVTKINFVPEGSKEGNSNSATAAGTAAGNGETAQKETTVIEEEIQPTDDIKPVGVEYIEEMKDDDGKVISFNCKLCECKFNDPNAKEMHMKGRRHRLQYKRKVQPDLVVDFKPNPRHRRLAEVRAQRAAEFWSRQRNMAGTAASGNDDGDDDTLYWDERRRYEEEFDYGGWPPRSGFGLIGPRTPHMRPLMGVYYGMMAGRRPENSDDRHVVARHAEIYPKEEELQTIQRIVSHTERALKYVSDALTDKLCSGANGKAALSKQSDATKSKQDGASDGEKDATGGKNNGKEDGRDNQMFSFQKDAEGGSVRILKGVMRVGLLAKGLLLQGDNLVQLVVLCAEKPTHFLLKRVASELPIQLKSISEDHKYTVTITPEEGAVMVSDGKITVQISLTSPLLREQQDSNNTAASTAEQSVQNNEDLLPREHCLQALAALRHAKWFQARATGLQSCVMVMRILRDLCYRTPTWSPLSQWAMELLVEKIISSAGIPLSPGDCVRRVMEAISSGLLITGPGILDPCEKEPQDALAGVSKQQREDLTVSAQQFLRFIAFRHIHKILGMEPLPAPKFQQRPWRFGRKRRRSGAEATESETDGKLLKKDGAPGGTDSSEKAKK